MSRLRYWFDWLFKDLYERKGKYVIAEVPNLPLGIFMISIIVSVAVFPGAVQKTAVVIAYLSMAWWGWLEWRGGRSRFRKLLGILGILSAVGACVLGLGF